MYIQEDKMKNNKSKKNDGIFIRFNPEDREVYDVLRKKYATNVSQYVRNVLKARKEALDGNREKWGLGNEKE
jgi:hypothetical protein